MSVLLERIRIPLLILFIAGIVIAVILGGVVYAIIGVGAIAILAMLAYAVWGYAHPPVDPTSKLPPYIDGGIGVGLGTDDTDKSSGNWLSDFFGGGDGGFGGGFDGGGGGGDGGGGG